MNKLTIPTILAITVLVAGIFAFMPIEDATTVHTTIIGATDTADGVAMGAVINIIADSATVKKGFICIEVTDVGADDAPDLNLEITEGGDAIILLPNGAIEAADGECSNFVGYRLFLDAAEAGDSVDYVVSFTEG